MIDVPTDPLITISAGVFTVNSLVSNERFQIVGGQTNNNPVTSRLNVIETMQVNNTFLLRGSYDSNPATFSGTLLRGTGGQGITIGGASRLDAATIQTDVTINEVLTSLHVANGLAVQGTFTVGAQRVTIWVEGSQTWSSGTFVTTGTTPAAGTGPCHVPVVKTEWHIARAKR